MDLAEAAVSNIKGRAEVRTVPSDDLLEVKSYLDDKFLLGENYFAAVYAGFASWAVARDAVSPYRSESMSGDSERQVSPDEWDPCFFASLALTGGAVWEGIGSPDKRREFWNWYLTTAVPDAFASASDR
jgi:hypothetical protein